MRVCVCGVVVGGGRGGPASVGGPLPQPSAPSPLPPAQCPQLRAPSMHSGWEARSGGSAGCGAWGGNP